MTSEVVLLNKEAIVLAADSAVTVGQYPHPRYSKNANKIFDISTHGNVAVTIFSSAEMDSVPWELTLKRFRTFDSVNGERERLGDYVPTLLSFLAGERALFPPEHRRAQLLSKLSTAAGWTLRNISNFSPAFSIATISPEERRNIWSDVTTTLRAWLDRKPLAANLSQGNFEGVLADPALIPQMQAFVDLPEYAGIDAPTLAALAVAALFKVPQDILATTGMVFAGYGGADIFPAYRSIYNYGFIGSEIAYATIHDMDISHGQPAWIQPFAQSSMIERFTDGFDYAQQQLLHGSVRGQFEQFVSELRNLGIEIDDAAAAPLIDKAQYELVANWRKDNWEKNFHPLTRVLASLSVAEMAHLAETLLVLESLRERVTSPSESVGGPVDVAAITKAEGLVWLRRKHYFQPELNSRYFARQR